MYKAVVLSMVMLATSWCYGQEKVEKKFNRETNLVEATYYHDNGTISQEGTFNIAGKLHGKWISYNTKGEKVAIGSYDNGVKIGKWYFWADDTIKEVEFNNNQIASVTEAKSSSGLADHQ